MNKEKKIIFDKNQLWVIHNVLGEKTKSPVGKFAILTNKGLILQIGGILNNGTYISDENLLPMSNHRNGNGEIRLFKELIGNCEGQQSLKSFEMNFCNIMSYSKNSDSWDRINNLLSTTYEGKSLVQHHGFKIHSIINLEKDGYGISTSNDKKIEVGSNTTIYCLNNSSLILSNI